MGELGFIKEVEKQLAKEVNEQLENRSIDKKIIRRKKSFTKYIGYQFWTSVLLILYHLLYIFKINTCLWTSTMCFMYGLVTIIAIFFFGGKATKEEFKKRFII